MSIEQKIRRQIAAKLARHVELDGDDRAAIDALPFVERDVAASSYLVREGQQVRRCPFLVSGMAYRHKLTNNGARQIVSLLVAGDFIDLPNIFLEESDHNVQALTAATVADIPMEALRDLALSRPAIGRALWVEALIEASIYREWLVNVGRRDAATRIGHLICEMAIRLEAIGAPADGGYELPMTQEQLGDTTGLTPVHVNRVLKALERDGLITRDRRKIKVGDWDKLRAASDFNPRYLHSVTE